MSLSTTQYGYIVDPMVPFTDDKGKTIKNGFIRVFMAGTSTPVLTYRNYDGATNQEKIELDNSGRVKHNVIGSKGSLYKVVVYNILHSQENPLLTVDKIAVLGSSINASGATIVTGLDSVTVTEENFLKATVEGTGVELALDPTEVTSEVSNIGAAETAAPDYVVPLLEKTGTEDSKKISLANIFKFALDWISRLATTITSFASGDFIAVSNTTDGTRKMSKDTLLELTAQNALAGNVATVFVPNETNAVAGKLYVYGGKLYVAKEDYSGAWDTTKFLKKDVEKLIRVLDRSVANLPYNENIPNDIVWKNGQYNPVTRVDDENVPDRLIAVSKKFLSKGTKIKFDLTGTSYQYTVYCFNAEDELISGGEAWNTDTEYVVQMDCGVRICIRRSNNANIDADAFDGSFISFSCVAKFGLENLGYDVVKKIEDSNLELIEKLPYEGFIPNDIVWKNGDYNPVTGQDENDVANRIIAVNKKPVTRGTKIKFDLTDTNYQYTIYCFSETGMLISGGESWNTDPEYVVAQTCGIRIKIRRSNDANIDASKFDNSIITFSYDVSDFKDWKKAACEKLPYERFIPNDIVWKNGQYNPVTRVDDENVPDRLIAVSKKFLSKGTKIKFDLTGTSYQYTVYCFNAAGELISGGEAWNTDPEYVVQRDCGVRICIRRSNNANMDHRFFDGFFISFTYVSKIGFDNLADEVIEVIGSNKVVDLFVFAGQSNMAGRGRTNAEHPETAPEIIPGAGYEYRPISDPTKLYPIAEPFGVNENNPDGINEPGEKTGSMVTAFVNAYYTVTKTPIIGVSAAKGGSTISQWQSNGVLLPDAIQRFSDAVTFLTSNGYTIRHKYLLWCQGESDGDIGTSKSDYKNRTLAMLNSFMAAGIEKMFMVRIGRLNIEGQLTKYDNINDAQTELCQENENVIMASMNFYSMQARGMMKDQFHYYQDGYNECGTYAGQNVGACVATAGKNPTMYDPKSESLYFSHKN